MARFCLINSLISWSNTTNILTSTNLTVRLPVAPLLMTARDCHPLSTVNLVYYCFLISFLQMLQSVYQSALHVNALGHFECVCVCVSR